MQWFPKTFRLLNEGCLNDTWCVKHISAYNVSKIGNEEEKYVI